MALKQGLLGKANEPLLGPMVTEGLVDSLALVGDERSDAWHTVWPCFEQPPGNVAEWASWLEEIEAKAVDLVGRIRSSDCRQRQTGRVGSLGRAPG